MILNLKGTTVFKKIYDEYVFKKNRFVALQGGRGSSKTWSLAQLFLTILLNERNILLTICRKTLPALKATAMKDFFEIMRQLGIYREEQHNMSDRIYKYKSNEIEFISVDQPTRIRGRKRQYLWLNESNEFSLEDFRQLNMRTDRQIFMDYNPADEYHWIYDNVLTRNDAVLIKSTYKDNPFLENSIIKEIERLKEVDKNYWRIYGLGERCISENKVITHWQYCDSMPDNAEINIYGLDFGYNHRTGLMEIRIKDDDIYWKERLYQSYLTNSDLIEKLKIMNLEKGHIIYADSAEPQRIEEIKRAGFNIYPAEKEVLKGIDIIKSHKLYITKDSINALKEVKSYSWKTNGDEILDEVVKENDDLMDAGRYGTYSYFFNRDSAERQKVIFKINKDGFYNR